MFGSKDKLGFTEDDLDVDLGRNARVRNDKLNDARNGILVINSAMALVLIPAFAVIVVTAVRSTDPDRWTDFWIGTAILLAIAFAVETFFVVRLLRSGSPGVFTGDERA